VNKQKQIAYLTYYKTNEEGEEISKTFATINFQEVFEFKAKAKEAKIIHKVNYTWQNVSAKTDDSYTVKYPNIPRPPKVKVKRPNLWQQLENWLQS
jgi:hypothetical protein